MNTRHTCSFRGTCEPDPQGRHPNLASCSTYCNPASQRDLLTLLYQHNPGDAALLAPTDREAVLFGLFQVRFPPNRTRDILLALEHRNATPLLDYPFLMEHVRSQWSPSIFRNSLLNTGDWRALDYLPISFRQLPLQQREQFVTTALFMGNLQTLRQLYLFGQSSLLRTLANIFLQPSISTDALRVMFENDGDYLSSYLPSAVRQNLQNFLQAALLTRYLSPAELEELRHCEEE